MIFSVVVFLVYTFCLHVLVMGSIIQHVKSLIEAFVAVECSAKSGNLTSVTSQGLYPDGA